jgi:hypothetical protein
MADFCEHGNEISASIKAENLLTKRETINYQGRSCTKELDYTIQHKKYDGKLDNIMFHHCVNFTFYSLVVFLLFGSIRQSDWLRLDDRGSVPDKSGDFSFHLHSVRTGSEAYTEVSCIGSKDTEA